MFVNRERVLFGALLGFGALLRLREYLANRSLWVDEALLALNVLGKSTADLVLRPLDLNQAAPPGFLFLAKLGVLAWGGSEYVLRLVPLLFSLASLPLLAWVARRLLAPGGALVALALFTVFPPLIRYAAEFKQYGLDVTVGIGVVAAALLFLNGPTRMLHAVALALTGVVAVWLSHPAPFFLAAVGVVLLIEWRLRGRPAVGTVVAVGAAWVASFAAVYLVSLRDLAAHPGLQRAWSGAFPPSVFSLSAVRWLPSHLVDFFDYAFAGASSSMGAFAVLAGCAALLTAQPAHLILLTAPMGFALTAALLGRYPFQGRLVLFALPLLALLAGAGVEHVRERMRGSRTVMVLLIAMLLFSSTSKTLSRLIRPLPLEEARPVIAYLQRRALPSDVVYLTFSAGVAYRYYAPRMGFRPQHEIIGEYDREDWQDIAADLEQLRGRGRVWILFSHARREEERFVLYYLDMLGARQDTFRAPGAAVVLYDLR